jgi:hypothetical protein
MTDIEAWTEHLARALFQTDARITESINRVCEPGVEIRLQPRDVLNRAWERETVIRQECEARARHMEASFYSGWPSEPTVSPKSIKPIDSVSIVSFTAALAMGAIKPIDPESPKDKPGVTLAADGSWLAAASSMGHFMLVRAAETIRNRTNLHVWQILISEQELEALHVVAGGNLPGTQAIVNKRDPQEVALNKGIFAWMDTDNGSTMTMTRYPVLDDGRVPTWELGPTWENARCGELTLAMDSQRTTTEEVHAAMFEKQKTAWQQPKKDRAPRGSIYGAASRDPLPHLSPFVVTPGAPAPAPSSSVQYNLGIGPRPEGRNDLAAKCVEKRPNEMFRRGYTLDGKKSGEGFRAGDM